MKKFYSFLLALVVGVGTMSAQGSVEVNGIWYLLNDDALTARVTYKGWSPSETVEYSGAVVVPATVSFGEKTYAVIAIYDHAFDGCYGMTSITLPEGIKNIGWSSFEGCTGLTSIVLPNSLEKISAEAFSGCTGLKSVTFGTGLKDVYYKSFMNCTAVESITCKATTPPNLMYGMRPSTEEDPDPDPYVVFQDVDFSQIPVYVPATSVPMYYRAEQWKDFKCIKAYDASTIVIDDEEAKATASENSVDISWRAVDEAVAYIIEIRHNEELICTMTFNAEGIILSATYAAPARDKAGNNAPAAVQTTANGWKYTIDGLETNVEYTYTVTAKNSDDGVIYTKTGTFTTQTSEGIDNVQSGKVQSKKFVRNGQIFILRGEKIYNAQGALVK